jgi:hypothetical protein
MKRTLSLALCLCLLAVTTFAQTGNTFKNIRYQGGTLATTTKTDSWDNNLTVTSDQITLKLKDGQSMTLNPKQVTGLSYGQEAHRRVGTMIALAVLLTPLALFGLMHKKRNHFIGVEYNLDGDKKGAWLLQADKDNYRGVLMALRGATGAKVAVAPDDRKYVPTGIETIEVKQDEKKKSE